MECHLCYYYTKIKVSVKTILVTGVSGFIGNHVLNQLLKHDNIRIIATSRNIQKAQKYNWFSNVSKYLGKRIRSDFFKYLFKIKIYLKINLSNRQMTILFKFSIPSLSNCLRTSKKKRL